MGATYIPVDGVERLDLLRVCALEERIQVVFPLLRRDALAHERAHVIAHIREEDIQSAQRPLCALDQLNRRLAV